MAGETATSLEGITEKFTSHVTLDVVGVVAENPVVESQAAVAPSAPLPSGAFATPDSMKSPPSEATLMSCGSDVTSPTALVIAGSGERDAGATALTGICEEKASTAALVVAEDEVEESMETRERKGAVLEASLEAGNQAKKSLSG